MKSLQSQKMDDALSSDIKFLENLLDLINTDFIKFEELISAEAIKKIEPFYYRKTWGGAGLIIKRLARLRPLRTSAIVIIDPNAIHLSRLVYLLKHNLKCIYFQNKDAFYYGIGKALLDHQGAELAHQCVIIVKYAINFLEEFK